MSFINPLKYEKVWKENWIKQSKVEKLNKNF